MDLVTAKKMVSLRLDEEILALLQKVQEAKDTIYWQRDRTWLIENALKQVYEPIVAAQPSEKEAVPS